MVHRNNLVAAIKVAGNVLREGPNATVTIPFGAEYSVYVKNLNSRRIKFKLSVDGKDATEGTWLIVYPNDSLELERFIRKGNLTSGNRFKFIERTAAIEEHRGVQAEDGLIRVEWLTERETISIPVLRPYDVPVPVERPYDPYDEYPFVPRPRPWPRYPRRTLGSQARSGAPERPAGAGMRSFASEPEVERFAGFQKSTEPPTMGAFASVNAVTPVFNEAGITVPGSQSNQQFHYAADFPCETGSQVLVINLRGQIAGVPVQEAVTVKYKPTCQTCGRVNQANAQFCSQCGTSLIII